MRLNSMNSRWAALVAASLVAFASLVITWQFRHYNDVKDPYPSISLSLLRGEQLSVISDIVEREKQISPASGSCRFLDLVLPKDAHVFMTDMTGPTNYNKIGYYFWITYYLFPREIGTSLDHITRITRDGFLGKTSESDQEILSNGFDVRLDALPGARPEPKALKGLPMRDPVNPDWFNSSYDKAMAFLLPLLTAVAGMWLFRFMFPALSERMPLLEQLACGLGLGMMAVAALTLGIKLCGFHGRGLILSITALGSIAEIWRHHKALWEKFAGGYPKIVKSPLTIVIFVAGSLVFLILFRLAGLQGLADDDWMRWMIKAKIIHFYHGNELVQWFSNPRLAHAHLDYPTLVPSLHAATYDSIGHVDEFVTKFWPTWMLLFLIAALASLNRAGNNWRHIMLFALLGLLLLPATQIYAQWEGSTMPMIFFTVLGFVQCALWLIGKDRARLGLGLTLLFGGVMTHFTGFVFLALVGSWLLLPSARPSLKPSPRIWRVLAFCLLSALPFVCLRILIPVLYYQSAWASYALHHPGITLSHWPGIFIILLARLFLSTVFANWNGEGEMFHWIGKWDGLSSLYNPLTLGIGWLCLFMALALWFAVPDRRRVVVWLLAMFIGSTVALSGVIASFITIDGLNEAINLTKNDYAGRYLLPMLLAWFATMMTLFFADPPSTTTADRGLPALKHGYWLAVGALLILVLGVFVLPQNEPSSPENLLRGAAAANSLNGSETNSPENPDLHMDLAFQLYNAGKFAEALQEFREAARLHPNDPLALNNLAWCLAANPRRELRNGKEAVQLASQAVELTSQQQPVFIGTLAAAYAEDGQFAKADEMAKRACDTALLNKQPGVAVMINEQLLQLYSAGKAVGLTNGP